MNFSFKCNITMQRDVSSSCTKRVLNRYASPYLFYEWSETQVEAAALWSAGCMCLYVHDLFCFWVASSDSLTNLDRGARLSGVNYCSVFPQRSCCMWTQDTFALTLWLVFNEVTIHSWPPPEVVWQIGSQSILNVFGVHLQLYFNVIIGCKIPTHTHTHTHTHKTNTF